MQFVEAFESLGYDSATSWTSSDRKGLKWRVMNVDDVSGLRLEAQAANR